VKQVFKKYKDVWIVLGAIGLFLLFYAYVQSAWVCGPWPETTPEERAYYEKGAEEYKKEQQRLKEIE